jgi:ribosome-binding protein aMBF1 (putative translation factor)
MSQEQTTSTRGGSRKGAGRKPRIGAKVKKTIGLEQDVWDLIDSARAKDGLSRPKQIEKWARGGDL